PQLLAGLLGVAFPALGQLPVLVGAPQALGDRLGVADQDQRARHLDAQIARAAITTMIASIASRMAARVFPPDGGLSSIRPVSHRTRSLRQPAVREDTRPRRPPVVGRT